MVLDLRYQQRDIRWEMRLRVWSGVTQASESTQESLIVNKPRPTMSTDVDRLTWAQWCGNGSDRLGESVG
jgi:hypothetical protein